MFIGFNYTNDLQLTAMQGSDIYIVNDYYRDALTKRRIKTALQSGKRVLVNRNTLEAKYASGVLRQVHDYYEFYREFFDCPGFMLMIDDSHEDIDALIASARFFVSLRKEFAMKLVAVVKSEREVERLLYAYAGILDPERDVIAFSDRVKRRVVHVNSPMINDFEVMMLGVGHDFEFIRFNRERLHYLITSKSISALIRNPGCLNPLDVAFKPFWFIAFRNNIGLFNKEKVTHVVNPFDKQVMLHTSAVENTRMFAVLIESFKHAIYDENTQ